MQVKVYKKITEKNKKKRAKKPIFFSSHQFKYEKKKTVFQRNKEFF